MKLIQIVGTSGSGKETIHRSLNERLRGEGYKVLEVIEPGPLVELAKGYRLRDDKDPWVETAIFTTDRLMNYLEHIAPHLNEENLIFSSLRGFLDTIVYQGLKGGVDVEVIKKMNSFFPNPDIALCLTVDGKIGNERIRKRTAETGEPISKSESPEGIDSLAEIYRSLPRYLPGLNIHYVDTTNLTREQTLDECYAGVKKIL